mmetsp:Transcript_44296/g.79460  ORF Transcript_44296/g.79460 Transcript_44296/m.79460 type:complete len:286 (-) Transcript_44296:140-997(-)
MSWSRYKCNGPVVGVACFREATLHRRLGFRLRHPPTRFVWGRMGQHPLALLRALWGIVTGHSGRAVCPPGALHDAAFRLPPKPARGDGLFNPGLGEMARGLELGFGLEVAPVSPHEEAGHRILAQQVRVGVGSRSARNEGAVGADGAAGVTKPVQVGGGAAQPVGAGRQYGIGQDPPTKDLRRNLALPIVWVFLVGSQPLSCIDRLHDELEIPLLGMCGLIVKPALSSPQVGAMKHLLVHPCQGLPGPLGFAQRPRSAGRHPDGGGTKYGHRRQSQHRGCTAQQL